MLLKDDISCRQSAGFDQDWIQEPISWGPELELLAVFIRWDRGGWLEHRGGEVWNVEFTSSFLVRFDTGLDVGADDWVGRQVGSMLHLPCVDIVSVAM
jgi:hypothetical protein